MLCPGSAQREHAECPLHFRRSVHSAHGTSCALQGDEELRLRNDGERLRCKPLRTNAVFTKRLFKLAQFLCVAFFAFAFFTNERTIPEVAFGDDPLTWAQGNQEAQLGGH